MQIACPKCRETYDVEPSLKGQNVECCCGEIFEVTDVEARVVKLPQKSTDLYNIKPEVVIETGHVANAYFLIPLLIGVLLIPLFFIGVVIILFCIINRYSLSYTLTNKRIMVINGVLIKQESEIRLADIRGMQIRRDVFDAVAKTGTLLVGTAATAGAEVKLTHIKNPKSLQEKIDSLR